MSGQRKVLIVSYYWPPAGGPGSQRTVKFAKYLSQFGWQPIVLTVERGEYPYIDKSLEEDIPTCVKIFQTKNWEPFLFYKKAIGRKHNEALPVGLLTLEKRSIKEKLAAWIRSNIFIPDARLGWIPFAVIKAFEIIRKEKIDLIFTSSPPHSLQLIGLILKCKTSLHWIADLRDPWTDIRYYRFINRTFWAQRYDNYLERQILKNADQITTVSKALSEGFQRKIPRANLRKFNVLPNGYDEENYKNLIVRKNHWFKIVHTGNLLSHQNPNVLWQALQKLSTWNREFKQDLKICLIGRVHDNIDKAIKEHKLEKNAKLQGFIPHKEVLKKIKNAEILLMVVPETQNNEGIVTSKFFEYVGSGRPILVIGPPSGDVGKIISRFNNSIICDYQDILKCCSFIEKNYKLWKKDKIPESEPNLRHSFSSEILTKELIRIFELTILDNAAK